MYTSIKKYEHREDNFIMKAIYDKLFEKLEKTRTKQE